MGKKKEGAAAKGRPAKPGSRVPLIAGVLLVVATLGIGGYWWTSGGSGGPVRGAKPAIPRVPRPVTLSPVLFTGYAAKGYQVAREIPEVLEHVMCYCGCDRNPGHQNNLDCFADDHGAG
jgi:hypothetical protein